MRMLLHRPAMLEWILVRVLGRWVRLSLRGTICRSRYWPRSVSALRVSLRRRLISLGRSLDGVDLGRLVVGAIIGGRDIAGLLRLRTLWRLWRLWRLRRYVSLGRVLRINLVSLSRLPLPLAWLLRGVWLLSKQ